MSANGISTLSTRQARQDAKLEIAEAKRQGKTITEGGGTYSISGAEDPGAPGYRSLNDLDKDLLPNPYNGNDVDPDDGDPGPLDLGRPWT